MFEEKNSATYLHALHVVSKLVVFIAVMVVIFTFSNPMYILAMGLLLFALILPARLPLEGVFTLIKSLLPVFVIIIVMSCFTSQPDRFQTGIGQHVFFTLFRDGRFPATVGGLLIGVTFLIRIVVMVLTTLVFTMTTPIDDIIDFMNLIHAPYELSIVISTAITFIPAMTNKKNLIFQAQRARGTKLKGKGMFGQLMAFTPIMIPLIINSILLAENLSISMLNRGYGASRAMTSMRDRKMTKSDYIVCCGAALVSAVSIYGRIRYKAGVL